MWPKTAFCNFFPLQTANVGYLQKKNPFIRNFCISGWLAVPYNPDKWSSTAVLIFMASVYMYYDIVNTEL